MEKIFPMPAVDSQKITRKCYSSKSYSLESKQSYLVLILRPFENGDLVVRLYVRLSGSRALMHCSTIRVNQSRKQSCCPLKSLRVERAASSLKFCRTSPNGQPLDLWTCLRFTSYERTAHLTLLFLAGSEIPNKQNPRSIS